MLCQVCGCHEAEKKLNKTVNGSLKTLYVCKQCFNRGGQLPPREERKCKFCGRTLTAIRSTLIVGCPRCYDSFSGELEEIIRQVQQL